MPFDSCAFGGSQIDFRAEVYICLDIPLNAFFIYMSRCFIGFFYSLNFVKSQIIPSIDQFEINPCLLINEPQNLNQASKEYHKEV